MRSLRSADGLTMIEVVVAAVVLMVGLIGLAGTFDSARRLSLLSERRNAMAHRAQLELERLLTYPYAELAMASKPTHSSEKTNPDYYVSETPAVCKSEGDGCYAWNALGTGEEETLVVPSSVGVVAPSPAGRECSKEVGACEWKDGLLSGKVYDFVTWHADKNCGAKCPVEKNYKRLTVVVTIKVPAGNHEPPPVRASTLIAEPG